MFEINAFKKYLAYDKPYGYLFSRITGIGRRLALSSAMQNNENGSTMAGADDKVQYQGWQETEGIEPTYQHNFNLISSNIGGDLHAPVLDIDFPATLVESKTPGHYHLYLDKVMTWETYKSFLASLFLAGVIEKGYFESAIARKATFARIPIPDAIQKDKEQGQSSSDTDDFLSGPLIPLAPDGGTSG